jgi:hypothetical protein
MKQWEREVRRKDSKPRKADIESNRKGKETGRCNDRERKE